MEVGGGQRWRWRLEEVVEIVDEEEHRFCCVIHFIPTPTIFVDGLPFYTNSDDQGSNSDTLVALLEHPTFVSAALSFKAEQETNFTISDSHPSPPPWVYVYQREFATVDPSLVHYVGTDEATTCVGLVIRNRVNGMTSVAHVDSPKVVDISLTQMLSQFADHNSDCDFDVHLVGGYEDGPTKHPNGATSHGSPSNPDGYSFPLCAKLIDALDKRLEKFHIRTLFVLVHNTKMDSEGNACPIFNGFLVETSSGALIPASFDRTTRSPDDIVRRVRLGASHEDPVWNGRLLETYDTLTDRFVIAPCSWTSWQLRIALTLQNLSDVEILLQCSTSPSAESTDFVDNLRRQWDYLIENPDWRDTFPARQPRVFERTAGGTWKRCVLPSLPSSQEDYSSEFSMAGKRRRGVQQLIPKLTKINDDVRRSKK